MWLLGQGITARSRKSEAFGLTFRLLPAWRCVRCYGALDTMLCGLDTSVFALDRSGASGIALDTSDNVSDVPVVLPVVPVVYDVMPDVS